MNPKHLSSALCLLVGLLALTAVSHTTSATTAVVPTIQASFLADSFTQPTDIANAGDSRLFITERAGRIRIINPSGTVLPTPFLDIQDRVDNATHSERGLLGLVFHPDYPNTPYFYVNYTEEDTGDTVVARFTTTSDSNIADAASELEILRLAQPAANHNAGDLNFGPDGYLYIGTGDGGSGGDPWGNIGNGQNGQALLGKMLRLDVDSATPYAIPPDNPFVDDPDVRDEIWALGLRNPWRFSFDRLTGAMYIADVGQNAWEEVNFQPASSTGGENYGWRCYEGTHAFNSDCGSATSFVFPFDDYPHSGAANDSGVSVTGGFVYRGATYPDLQGYYLYADFGSSNVWLAQDDDGWQITPLGNISGLSNISTFGEGCDGELYAASYGGTIFQITTAQTANAITGGFLTYLPIVIGPTAVAPTCSS